MMRCFNIGIATLAVSLALAGSSANAQTRGQARGVEKPNKIDILSTKIPNLIDTLATGSIGPGGIGAGSAAMGRAGTGRINTRSNGTEADISDFVVGAVMNNNDMLSYCLNISDAATEARNSILQKMMKETESKIADKLAMLEAKTAMLEDWVNRRDMFMKSANKTLVSIFETMRPDAAAGQISELKVELAAAIILKLQPKIASVIMTEIQPKHAAKITSMLTSAIDISDTQGNVNVNSDEKMSEQ